MKIFNLLKKYRAGALAGGLVGLGVAAFYRLSGGDFMFAVANIQSRAAESTSTLSQPELLSLAYVTTLLSFIIIGAIIGMILDHYIGLNFSKKTRMWLLIATGILLAYTLFGDNLGRAGIESRAGAFQYFQTLSKSSGGFLLFLGIVVTSLFSFLKSLVAPASMDIPIWIWFVAGFLLMLLLRRRQPEQPIVIQR